MNSKISKLFRNFGDEYLLRYSENMPITHKKVINAIIGCKTEKYGKVYYKCDHCGAFHSSFRSCGNRHCPNCQALKSKEWFQKQMKKKLPGHYFMMTFTVPEEARFIIRSNQKIAYAALFKSASETIKKLSGDTRFSGEGIPGFFGVLHTWGRQLQYHPHIHFIIAGGTINKDLKKWNPSRKKFFLPVKALSKIFRAKFCHEMKKANLLTSFSTEIWKKGWNVNSQYAGNGVNCLKYLSRYVFKVAISDSRIIKVENRKVYFKYRAQKTSKSKVICLEVMEFMRRFLQHVLPSGFMKIRYYGFLHPCCSISFDEIKKTISDFYGVNEIEEEFEPEKSIVAKCKHCGHNLTYLFSILPSNIIITKNAGEP